MHIRHIYRHRVVETWERVLPCTPGFQGIIIISLTRHFYRTQLYLLIPPGFELFNSSWYFLCTVEGKWLCWRMDSWCLLFLVFLNSLKIVTPLKGGCKSYHESNIEYHYHNNLLCIRTTHWEYRLEIWNASLKK